MKKRVLCAVLLCAALTFAAAIAPIRSRPLASDTNARLEAPYVFLDAWGSEIGIFKELRGIAVSGERVYVADTYSHRIQVFDVHGRPPRVFGGQGSGEAQFDRPFGIAVDGSGNVYVADTYNHRVQKLTTKGTYLAQWGSEGSGEGQFDLPCGIAADGAGNVYVADTYNHRCFHERIRSGCVSL